MSSLTSATIALLIQQAHQRTLQLIAGLNSEQMMGPRLPIVNPLRWEIGHAAYFYEYWLLRHHLGQPPLRADADQLYDSIRIAHDQRWDLPLPSLPDTLHYLEQVQERVLACLTEEEDPRRDYLAQYALFHQAMHNEAYTYSRQTLAYPTPDLGPAPLFEPGTAATGDALIPGGLFMLGASPRDGFVFDNEKWAHPVEVAPFAIARTAVSNGDYLAFVEAGGYRQRRYWSNEGWDWRKRTGLEHPLYWRQQGGDWQQRHFDRWQPLLPDHGLIHVCWYEAQAYCRWAERRLPSEVEWEMAAAAEPGPGGLGLSPHKRRFPWGDSAPAPGQANLGGTALGTVDVNACPGGDSAFGCRQMIGNTWEWTADRFGPYPGFTPDMYADYSQPLFGHTRVLRGGGWATHAPMIRNSWRTYYGPERNDVFAGFRTCAL
ncbi:selenoneine synthase SenA [Aestuariirhabdus litorea]|uniref:Ergothioneine biosynthesis protein EgtB n=1 Tax=Aestuariirhabdus litorea TaxID=2528527 RepID=A0A3P3VJB7_9GAMM|nr:selenoneine synthase SenA [Aestuariirhabdus litorea]RRJ82841.1 ergothioneine biosynthesis protein EgtB [Aestuariirhabdus litorea]RWW93000.1 ergothioneine biosynthesis protein EgtB [Endozoicomonadaceae bacterium GTF-13]